MAGGIDWFRWHHGSVTDPKFALVAKRAGARLGDVLALWAYVLEQASASDDRGALGAIDAEAIDLLLDLPDGQCVRILDAMAQRGLLTDTRVASWEKRQPKREDDTAAERKRRQREREHEMAVAAAAAPQEQERVTETESRDVTQSHADVTHGHDRGEESREEERKPSALSAAPTLPACPFDSIVGLYHEHLPTLPAVKLMPDKRRTAIRKLWTWVLTSRKRDGTRRATSADEALGWIGGYFAQAAENDFLTGKLPQRGAHANWRCDLDFLLTERGMTHVIEKTLEAA